MAKTQTPEAGAAADASQEAEGMVTGAGGAVVDASTGEIVEGGAVRLFSPLANLNLGDAAAALREMMAEAVPVRSITGELDVASKEALVGRPFVVLDYRENDGDFGPFYSVAAGLVETGEIVIFNDGGQSPGGIPDTLRKADERGHVQLACPAGLKASHYEANDKRPAGTTYYFA